MRSSKIVFIVFFCFIQFLKIYSQNANMIYLNTDRSYYLPGESVFFKAYIFDNPDKKSNQFNDTLNVAIIDQEGIEITSATFPVNNSLLTGKIELPDFLTEGNYILIAFTLPKNNPTSGQMFSKIIEIRKSVELNASTDLSLTDTLYEPGGLLTAKIRFSVNDNKSGPINFTYKLSGLAGEILNGKGKSDSEGMTTLTLRLPEFDNKENMKLLVIPSYKGLKTITGVVIPTKYNLVSRKSDAGRNLQVHDSKQLNIQVKTDKLLYGISDNVRLEITVTDDNGVPVRANLSVSASVLFPYQFQFETNNIVSYMDHKSNLSIPDTVTDFRKYFAQYLVQVTQTPGKPFIFQEKNNSKKLKRKAGTTPPNQDGYPGERSIYDILKQIKPYHIENGRITFGAMNSLNNLDGALIIVDGIKIGTEASILDNIPVPDIARITVSTNLMDIQRYSGMNNVGIIEIFMKNTSGYLKNKEADNKDISNTLFWGPEIITDTYGKTSVSFRNNNKSAEIVISVDGIAANGLFGSGSARYSVK